MYSYPGKGSAASMSLSIANNIEAKVRDIKDTTGTGSKKIKLIDQLNFSTGYNFLADSLKMNNIGVTMSTSVFGLCLRQTGHEREREFRPVCD